MKVKVSELITLIEDIRFKRCMSQVRFANSMGINEFTYLRTINGITKPSFVTLAKMIAFMKESGFDIELER